TAIATSHTQHLLNADVTPTVALTSGFHYALVACGIFLVAAGAIASRASNSRPQTAHIQSLAEPAGGAAGARPHAPPDADRGARRLGSGRIVSSLNWRPLLPRRLNVRGRSWSAFR